MFWSIGGLRRYAANPPYMKYRLSVTGVAFIAAGDSTALRQAQGERPIQNLDSGFRRNDEREVGACNAPYPSNKTFSACSSASGVPNNTSHVGWARSAHEPHSAAITLPSPHILHNPAIVQLDQPPREIHDQLVVGGEYEGDVVLGVHLHQHLHQVLGGFRIEVRGRFVGQDQRGAGDDGARDRDALLLAAGQFAGLAVFESGETDFI